MDGPPAVITDQVRRLVLTCGGTGNEPAVWYASALDRCSATVPVGLGNEPSTRPIYVVLVRGEFSLRAARVPYGAAPPRGHILLMAFDRATGERIPTHLLLRQEPVLEPLGTSRPLTY